MRAIASSSKAPFNPVALGFFGLLVAGAGSPVFAQAPTPAQQVLEDQVTIDAGVFITNFQMKARLDGESSKNPEYDFGREFGGEDGHANRFRADGLWRITPAHHLRVMYFNNTRTASRSISETIEWGDVTYQAGVNLAMESKQEIIELAYEWAFLRTPTYEVSGTFGVHYTELSLQLSGNGTVSGGSGGGGSASFQSKRTTVPVPLPVLGIRAGWAVSPNWYLDVSGQIFKAKVGDYDGLIQDLRANATWMFNQHLGVGVGYNIFTTNIDVSRDNFEGRLRWGYSGFQAFVKAGF